MISLVGHGYIGSAIAAECKAQGVNFHWYSHTNLDTSHVFSPIINAAGFIGIPNVDACETQREETILGNVAWPLMLANSFYNPVIHISSGCIYQGDNGGKGWTEEDEPNFDGSFYAVCKRAEQKALAPYLTRDYLLRIRMPFDASDNPRNFLTKLRAYPRLVDGVNSLSWVESVAKSAIWFALNRPKPGIYNCVNPGAVRTRDIAEKLGLNKPWFTPEEFEKATIARRSFCVLNTDKMQNVFPLPSAEKALDACAA